MHAYRGIQAGESKHASQKIEVVTRVLRGKGEQITEMTHFCKELKAMNVISMFHMNLISSYTSLLRKGLTVNFTL